MRTFLAITAWLLLGSYVPDGEHDFDAIQPIGTLEGDWNCFGSFQPGFESRLEFKNGKVRFITYDNKGKLYGLSICTYKVDLSREPPAIDLADLNDKDDVTRGIYRITGNSLEMCINNRSGPRPNAFAEKAGTNWVLIRVKRVETKPISP